MTDSSDHQQSPKPDDRRRKTLLFALAGAGVPLSQRVISGQWVAPVVDAVVLPAHAATSQPESHVTGMFASTLLMRAGSSPFANVAERSEEEILDLFVSAAEAAVDGCTASNSCSGTYSAELVDVVATVDQNPTSNACVQARVNFTGCGFSCLTFDFQNVVVDGENVSISGSCALSLTGVTLTEAGLDGHWSYSTDTVIDGVKVIGSGRFAAPPGDRGCGDLSPCPM